MRNNGEEQIAHLIMKLRGQGLRSSKVLSAIEKIPRDIFIEKALKNHAWENVTLPIGGGQTISQPYIVGLMTTLLDLYGNEIVLEIGTGSGYQASILSVLCRRVYTIERIEMLHQFSNNKFKELGLTNITTKHGNGSDGWPEVAPFDRIILTCAINEIPKILFHQLKVGGILVGPEILDNKNQVLNKYIQIEKNKFEKEKIEDVKFVPML
ncbi:MAG: protein-L-isoaspartate O-methyltransferase [SAR116 cluster bacterium]|nr:protein-L-isoaspartate O-methyltransferase [SAR116 cluster bacterium]